MHRYVEMAYGGVRKGVSKSLAKPSTRTGGTPTIPIMGLRVRDSSIKSSHIALDER